MRKVVESEQDSFQRAKIQIVFTVLLFSLAKVLVVIPIALQHAQHVQVLRAAAVAIFFLFLIKLLLYRPSRVLLIAHCIVISGIGVIYSNLLFYAQHVNIITVQVVFVTTLTAYYLIGRKMAAFYTFLAMAPVMAYLLITDKAALHLDVVPQEVPSPAYEIIIVLNFITFVLVHYLYYRAFYQNLEEKENLNLQLQVNVSEAKALAESRALFLSTMSHELRTPLNGVIGMANLLKDNALDEQKDHLDILEFSAGNLLSVINDILDYNKSEQGKIELESIPVDIPALMYKIGAALQLRASEKALTWKLELDEKLKDCVVFTDPTRLTQIIYNLAGNAIKFTDQGTVGVTALILDQTENKINIHFAVSDTGIGIAPDRQEAIFDPFTQASSDTTRHFGGTGLGLAIVKKLLRLFKSSIRLGSQPGHGSVFSFAIGFTLCKTEVTTAPEFKATKNGLKGLKLLIVEDNRVNILLLERLLSRWGIESVVGQNGQDAFTLVGEQQFDGVLMDLHMPIMDGYEATTAIRSMSDPVKANVYIIALTASVSYNINAKIKDAGMQDYLPKPFLADQLYEKLKLIPRLVS